MSMPATKTKSTNTPKKPYLKPDPNAAPPTISSAEPVTPTKANTKTSKVINRSPAKAWTGEEYQMLFQYAIKNGAPGSDSGWEGVVPGRTGSQARNAWRGSIAPGCLKYLDEKGI